MADAKHEVTESEAISFIGCAGMAAIIIALIIAAIFVGMKFGAEWGVLNIAAIVLTVGGFLVGLANIGSKKSEQSEGDEHGE